MELPAAIARAYPTSLGLDSKDVGALDDYLDSVSSDLDGRC